MGTLTGLVCFSTDNYESIVNRILKVNEEIVEKRSDFCLSVEAWRTGFKVAECETEWRDTSPHSKKKSLFVQQ